jgi:transposase
MTYARDQAGHRVTTENLCYRARNLIERFFNKLKQWRRVATRCDKLAANYLAVVKLASIAFRCAL